MNAKLLTSTLALSCSVALLCSSIARGQAPAGAGDQPTVQIEADSSELGKRGTGLDKVVLDRLVPALEAEGIETEGSADAIGVRVIVAPVDMEAFHYSIRFEIERDGAYAQVLGAVDCKPCIDATLLAKIDARAPALADLIKERASEGDAPPPEGETGDEEEGETDDEEEGGSEGGEEPDPPELPKPIGTLGYVGIGAAALGLGATIAGAVELSRGVVFESLGNQKRNRIDHRTPGLVLVGVGATVAVVGLVVLGVDLGVRAKKRKTRAAREQTRIFPLVTPGSVGLGVSGAF